MKTDTRGYNFEPHPNRPRILDNYFSTPTILCFCGTKWSYMQDEVQCKGCRAFWPLNEMDGYEELVELPRQQRMHQMGYPTQPIRTSTIHSRIEGKRCIEGCLVCAGVKKTSLRLVIHPAGDWYEEVEEPIAHESIPNWRSMTNADYDQFLEWVDTNTLNRWQLGQERYLSDVKGFQGDPIDHAIEETFDSLLYLWIAKRRQDSQ